MAGDEFNLKEAIVLSAILSVMSYAAFIYAAQIAVPSLANLH